MIPMGIRGVGVVVDTAETIMTGLSGPTEAQETQACGTRSRTARGEWGVGASGIGII